MSPERSGSPPRPRCPPVGQPCAERLALGYLPATGLVGGVGWATFGIGAVIGLLGRAIELFGGRPGPEPFSLFVGFGATIPGAHLGRDPLLCTGGLVVLGSAAWAVHRQTARDEGGWDVLWYMRSRPRYAPPARHRQG